MIAFSNFILYLKFILTLTDTETNSISYLLSFDLYIFFLMSIIDYYSICICFMTYRGHGVMVLCMRYNNNI